MNPGCCLANEKNHNFDIYSSPVSFVSSVTSPSLGLLSSRATQFHPVFKHLTTDEKSLTLCVKLSVAVLYFSFHFKRLRLLQFPHKLSAAKRLRVYKKNTRGSSRQKGNERTNAAVERTKNETRKVFP